MTQDYKDKLFNYVIGNYETDTPSGKQIFTYPNKTNTLFNEINNRVEKEYIIDGILQGKNSSDDEIMNYLLYAHYTDNSKSFIVILDKGYNFIQLITNYNTGTELGLIKALNVAEDGTLYGIDVYNNTQRFIQLNNPLIKLSTQENYSLVLRISYYIPETSSAYDFDKIDIMKSKQNARYLMYGSSSGTLFACELVVKVGESNEWNSWATEKKGTTIYSVEDCLVSWDDEEQISFEMLVLTTSIIDKELSFRKYYNNGTGLDFVVLGEKLDGNSIPTIKLRMQYGRTSSRYYAIYEQTQGTSRNFKVDYLYESGTQTNSITVGYESEETAINELFIQKFDTILFFALPFKDLLGGNNYIVGYKTPHIGGTGQIIANGVEYDNILFGVQRVYNLYNVLLLENTSLIGNQIIYEYFSYTDNPYTDYTSLSPHRIQLLNNTNNVSEILFDRNLYNKTIIGNMTTSTIQIPNLYLNDDTVNQSKLLSQCNNIMSDDADKEIITNRYEELYVNYMIRLNCIDENNLTDIKYYNEVASVLNNAISKDSSSETDYNNIKIGKYKINYSDNTTSINNLSSPTINNGVATYQIAVVVPADKTITTIDFLTNDETQTYLKIDTSNLENDKYYIITQDVEVR